MSTAEVTTTVMSLVAPRTAGQRKTYLAGQVARFKP